MSSCQASFGEKYVRGNLEIYFTKEMKSYVETTADYFEENGLIQESKHSIQLTSSELGSENPGLILKMVESAPNTDIPSNQMNNISSLESELRDEVFLDPNFRIVICNENFVEIQKWKFQPPYTLIKKVNS